MEGTTETVYDPHEVMSMELREVIRMANRKLDSVAVLQGIHDNLINKNYGLALEDIVKYLREIGEYVE